MNSFIYMLYPKRYINSLEKKFKRLGSSNKIDINIFLITRLILEFILFILLLLIPVYGLILSILFTVLFHFLYEDLILKDRKSTRLNSSHVSISYAVFCLKKKNKKQKRN